MIESEHHGAAGEQAHRTAVEPDDRGSVRAHQARDLRLIAEPMHGSRWLMVSHSNEVRHQVVLVSPDEPEVVVFKYAASSGTDQRRAQVHAIAWAQSNDLPAAKPKKTLTYGDGNAIMILVAEKMGLAPALVDQAKRQLDGGAVTEIMGAAMEREAVRINDQLRHDGSLIARANRFAESIAAGHLGRAAEAELDVPSDSQDASGVESVRMRGG